MRSTVRWCRVTFWCPRTRCLANTLPTCSTVSPELAFPPDVEPATDMVITDDFLRHVREETVHVKRTATLRFDTHGVIFADGTRCDVEAIVMCTGYTTVLPLLEQSVLTALEFDPDDRLQPTLLHKQVFHPALPGLAFVGHYRGPYFPVMELQSRWTQVHGSPAELVMATLRGSWSIDRTVDP